MRIIKIFLSVAVILFSFNILAYANEKKIDDNSAIFFSLSSCPEGISKLSSAGGNEILKSRIKNYRMSNAQMAQMFKILFIAGIIIGSTGLLMIIPGAIMMGISVGTYQGPYYWIGLQNDPGYNLWFGGISLLASGSALFVIGLSMMIAGLILNWYYGGRIVLKSETDINRRMLKAGLSYGF